MTLKGAYFKKESALFLDLQLLPNLNFTRIRYIIQRKYLCCSNIIKHLNNIPDRISFDEQYKQYILHQFLRARLLWPEAGN
jgi:hypothetical protein